MKLGPDGIEWTEDKFYQLAAHLQDILRVDYDSLVSGLSWQDDQYGCFLLTTDEKGKLRVKDLIFSIDFGGGTPYPINVDFGRLRSFSSDDIGGHDQHENFTLEY